MNFQIATYPTKRAYVASIFKDCSYCYDAHPKDFRTYLDDMLHSKFVLSPRGNGLDCHRTWEALLMGAIPIVKSSNIDSLFEDLPVLIVSEWDEVTEEFLNEKYEEMQSDSYQMQKQYCDYWFELIDSFISNVIQSKEGEEIVYTNY